MIVDGLVYDTKSLDLILKQRRTIEQFSVEDLFHSRISAASWWWRGLEGTRSEVATQTLVFLINISPFLLPIRTSLYSVFILLCVVNHPQSQGGDPDWSRAIISGSISLASDRYTCVCDTILLTRPEGKSVGSYWKGFLPSKTDVRKMLLLSWTWLN